MRYPMRYLVRVRPAFRPVAGADDAPGVRVASERADTRHVEVRGVSKFE